MQTSLVRWLLESVYKIHIRFQPKKPHTDA